MGGGGREHALAWKLAGEPGVNEVIVAPGQRRDRRASRGSAACRASTRSTPAAVVARRPARGGRAGRHRARGAAGGRRRRCARARPGSRSSGRRRGGRPDRDRARRSATRSRRPPASGWPRRRAFDGARRGAARSPRTLAADGRGVVVKADGLAAGKGVTVCDDVATRPRRRRIAGASGLAAHGAAGPRVVRRGAPRRPRGQRHRPVRRPRRASPCRCPRPQAPARRRRRPEHRRHGRLQPARRTCPTTASSASSSSVPPADPRRAGPARDPVPWRAVRRPDADRRRPGPPRVQRPLRRPGDAGRSCRGWRSRSGRSCWPRPRGDLAAVAGGSASPARRLPVLPGRGRRRSSWPAAGYPDAPTPRRPRSTGLDEAAARGGARLPRRDRARRRRHGPDGRRPGPHGRRPRAGPRRPRATPPSAPRTRSRFDGLQRRHDIGARRRAVPRRPARPDDPALHAARDGRDLVRAARFEAMLRVELAVARAQAAPRPDPAPTRSPRSRRAPASTSTGSPRSSGRPTTTSSPSSARSPRRSGPRAATSTSA